MYPLNSRIEITVGMRSSSRHARAANPQTPIRSYTMKNFSMIAKQFVNDESGQDLIEYALVAAIIGLGAVTTMTTLATDIASVFTSVGNKLTAAV